MSDALKSALRAVTGGRSLSREEARGAADAMLEPGEGAALLSGALLAALATRGETADELAGVVDALLARSTPLAMPRDVFERTVDVCGTGGDGLGTFNVSTVTACVVAGAGVPVAKHGGRSVSSASGSADVLAALGVVLEMPRRAAERALAEGGLAFLFAPAYHPAMLAVAPLRRALGVRTVFNLAGPLANPVRVSRQLVGVDRPERIAVIAGALRSRGLARAWVVSNEVAGDELLPFGKTRVTALEGSSVRSFELSAGDFGLPECAPSDLAGGGPEENAGILTRILAGETGPRRNAVLMNAAAALVVAGATDHVRDGVARAAESIDSGRAAQALATLVERSRETA